MRNPLADVAPAPSEIAPWLIGCLACVIVVVAAVVTLVVVLIKRSKRKQG